LYFFSRLLGPRGVQKDGPRINQEIRAREVRLIDKDGHDRGNVPIADALALAQESGLDLVEIAPEAEPQSANCSITASTSIRIERVVSHAGMIPPQPPGSPSYLRPGTPARMSSWHQRIESPQRVTSRKAHSE